MRPRAYIVTESESRYSLLGAMGQQFGLAMARCGLEVNPDAGGPAAWSKEGRAAYIFFNHLASVEEAYGWAGAPERMGEGAGGGDGGRAVVQWCVDHPLTIAPEWLDRMSADPGFRLLTVTSDDAHLLALRFPRLKHATVWHGVDESALCDPTAIENTRDRDIDVIIAGSIASDAELARLLAQVPGVLRSVCDEVVALRLAHPTMSFGQAVDLALPSGARANDHWLLMKTIFAYTTAVVGRARRVAAAQAMQGLNVMLVGTEAWREFATGTLKYAGRVGYQDLPGWLMRSKVCLAVSPPQFVAGFSERVLLSMAAGCATVAEERVMLKKEFGTSGAIKMYTPDRPALARAMAETLLGDAKARTMMGAAGREIVVQGHLWGHRVEMVMAAAGMIGMAASGSAGEPKTARMTA
jgi:hypothetical protein